MTLFERFNAFLDRPDPQSWRALRDAIVASEYYAPYSAEVETVEERLEQGDLDGAEAALKESMPNLLLSANAHLLAALIAQQRDNEDAATFEMMLAQMCCQGILDTGDGTAEAPYLVMRISDEYDMLRLLNKKIEHQALYDGERGRCDVVTCEDGTELWFNIQDAWAALES